MRFKYYIVILLSVFCLDVYGGIFKCIDDKGKTIYQQRPCDKDSEVSEQMSIQTQSSSGPVALNSKNKKSYELALHSNSMVVIAKECRVRNSSYTEEVQQASDRLYEIRKSEIEAGKEVLRRGFPGLPPSEMASLRNKGKRKLQTKLSKMSKEELDRFCGSQARKARSLAAATRKRSSGYKEGDIDPEGND